MSGELPLDRASATFTSGAIPTASAAIITVVPGADLTLGAAASGVSLVVSGTRDSNFNTISAYATVGPQATAVVLLATGQGATGYLQNGQPGDTVRAEYGGNIFATMTGGQVSATFGSSVLVEGPSNTATVQFGGRVTLVGDSNTCAANGGT